MKKAFLCALILSCLFMTGCDFFKWIGGKKENELDANEKIAGGWNTVLSNQVNDMDEETIRIFNNAKANYKDLTLELVALFGKQVVAGTNYMFLAKGYEPGYEYQASYKIVIVYHDLQGNDTVTKVSSFNYMNYVNNNIDGTNEQLSGGWYVESSGRPYTLFENGENNVFEKATSTLAGMSYKPLVIVGKQIVSGTNYAVLCYGSATVPDAKEGIYLLTLYEDLNGNGELLSSAYIDLANFNK